MKQYEINLEERNVRLTKCLLQAFHKKVKRHAKTGANAVVIIVEVQDDTEFATTLFFAARRS